MQVNHFLFPAPRRSRAWMVIALLAVGGAIHAGGGGATNPLAFSQWQPIVVSGKLELTNDQYMFYRPANAETVNP